MSTLYMDEATMRTKIELLRIQKAKIDEVLEKVKGDTLQIKDYWTGETGDAVSEELNSYTNEFDYISSKLEKQITSLENAVDRYHNMNIAVNKHIDQNTETAAI